MNCLDKYSLFFFGQLIFRHYTVHLLGFIPREQPPELKIIVIYVVDLIKLQPETEYPHKLSHPDFDTLFTKHKPVIFTSHGYP
jgi:phosphoketolase